MKNTTTKILIITSALLSFNVNAHLLQYNLNFVTTDVEGEAFGGIAIDDEFQGNFEIDTHVLQDAVDLSGLPTVEIPLSRFDVDSSNDVFNLSYTFNIGNKTFTENSVAFFESTFTVDNKSNVEGVIDFSMELGDLSFDDLEFHYDALGGQWSATDDFSSNVVHGTFTISQVPVPAAIWMLGSGLIGLVGFRKKKA